jgi:hypothetical protein
MIIPMDCSPELPDAVRRMRRGLRDVRDRMARRRRHWRDVGFAGMAGGDGTALVLVSHDGLDGGEVAAVLRRRWPDAVITALDDEEPTVAMSVSDAVDLGRCRRGVEPLRIVVMPQQHQQPITSLMVEPMPVIV